MSAELLLQWASEVGSGSLGQWRDAAAWAVPGSDRRASNRLLATMSALGHAEVDWEAGQWHAMPPALTLLPDAGGHALLTGARTGAFRLMLESELSDSAGEIGVDVHLTPQASGPDSCYVAADSEGELIRLKGLLRITYSYSLPLRLEGLLPAIPQLLSGRESVRSNPELGLERFDPETLFFEPASSHDAAGLYRYEGPGRRELRWVDDGGEVYRVDQSVGTYAEMARVGSNQRPIQWWRQGANGDLGIRLTTPLPPVHARAATLCSGRAPRRRGSVLLYPNVPSGLATAIAVSLGQELVKHDIAG